MPQISPLTAEEIKRCESEHQQVGAFCKNCCSLWPCTDARYLATIKAKDEEEHCHYFVSYSLATVKGQGFGNLQITTSHPLSTLDEIRAIEVVAQKLNSQFANSAPIVLSYQLLRLCTDRECAPDTTDQGET